MQDSVSHTAHFGVRQAAEAGARPHRCGAGWLATVLLLLNLLIKARTRSGPPALGLFLLAPSVAGVPGSRRRPRPVVPRWRRRSPATPASRSDRVANYNQLLRIKDELGSQAIYAGVDDRGPRGKA